MPDRPAAPRGKGKLVNDLLLLLGALVAWIALQAWILPRLGVST
jgi:hypothetical protein